MYGNIFSYLALVTIVGYASGSVVESNRWGAWVGNVTLALVWVGSVVGTVVIYLNAGGTLDFELTWHLFVTLTGLLVVVPCIPLAATHSQAKAKPLGETLARYGFAAVVTLLTVAGVFLLDSIAWRALTTGTVFVALVLVSQRVKPWFVGYDRTDSLGDLYDLGDQNDETPVRTVPTRQVAIEVVRTGGGNTELYVSSGFRDRLSPETQRSLVALERCRAQGWFREKRQLLLGLPAVAVVAVLPSAGLLSVPTGMTAVAVAVYYLLVVPRLVETLVYRYDERTVSQLGEATVSHALEEYARVVGENGGRVDPVFGPTYRERQRRLTDGNQ